MRLFFKTKWLLLIICVISIKLKAQNTFLNPILSGSHPDPSICRVDSTYYMVNSTFEYFPGLPIHKSTDLVNWELIGYGIHEPSQGSGEVNLTDVQSDGGIHAPTIRFHKGLFYIITTNVYYHEDTQTTDFVNFIITAKDPAGPWSQPHVLEDAPGIDPDIFFDDNGKVWYVGTHSPENPNFEGEGEIWLQEIDIENWTLIGNRHFLWRGACGGLWAEGPHMYKYDNRYYLMIAEGGTSYNHAVMIAVSDTITGPFISNERNPIFTTRHLSYDNWVHSTGHADMFQTHDNQWYMVALGIRGDQDRGSNMGRESFLIPMKWEEEPFDWKPVKYKWPVISPKHGKILRQELLPFISSKQSISTTFKDNFEDTTLNLEWNFRRVPKSKFYNLTERSGFLRIYGSTEPIANRKQTSLIGFRQRESDFEYSAKIDFNSTESGSAAGLSLFQKDDNYINFLIKHNTKNQKELIIEIASNGTLIELSNNEAIGNYKGEIEFKVLSKNGKYQLFFRLPNSQKTFTKYKELDANIILSKGYTGAFLGLYCRASSENSTVFMDVDKVNAQWFIRN